MEYYIGLDVSQRQTAICIVNGQGKKVAEGKAQTLPADKVFLFIEDMQKLGRHLEAAKSSYADTMNKLSEGRGNILRRTEDLKVLGVKASKKLPVELLSPAGTGEDAEIVSITDKAQAS